MTDDAVKTTQKKPQPAFRIVHGAFKTIAILVGLPLTVFSLMSVVGLATDNIWIRLIPAVIVALGAPLFLVDRLLPDNDQARARGMPTDVLATSWLAFGVLFVGLAQPVTGSLLIAEADRYVTNGSTGIARVGYWLGGVTPIAATAAPGTEASDGDAQADAGAASADGGSNRDDSSEGDGGVGGDGGTRSDGGGGSSDTPPPDAGNKAPAKSDASAAERLFTPAEIFAKLSPAIVTISVRNSRNHGGSGTGFFIDDEGTIATNQHVIRDAQSVGVKLIGEQYEGGHRWLHEVELLVEDQEVDLALLRVPPQSDIGFLPLGDSDAVAVGRPVLCIGNPLGLEHTLSDGLVSARRVHDGRRWIQMTAPISSGNSGGPVIAMNGNVIGIATATINRVLGNAQNLNLAVPVNVLKAMIRDDYPDRRRFESGPGGPSTW